MESRINTCYVEVDYLEHIIEKGQALDALRRYIANSEYINDDTVRSIIGLPQKKREG